MLILCQQRDTIVNLDKVQALNVHLENRREVCAWFDVNETNRNSVLLGKYNTESRATEVLQEILVCYLNSNSNAVGFVKNSVYIMPED